MLRILGWLLLILLIAVGVWGFFFLRAAGTFLELKPVPLACRTVTGGGIVGVEDLTIDPETKLAYLSGYDRRAAFSGKPARGAIWVYDLNTADAVPVDATAAALPDGFQPHGISLYRDADGKRTLFAISHVGGKHSVEIFDVDGATLTHRRTVTGEAMVSPNDLVGIGADAFYVSNDHANPTGTMRTVEDYLRLPLTTVQYFDGQNFKQVLSGIGGANGINVSADGKSLYLSAASEQTVYVYDRDPATNELKQRAAVAVPGWADNLEMLSNGDLLLGLHSKVLELVAHIADPAKHSASHVMRLRADGKGSFVPQTVYYNLGEEISGVSVGASVDKRLLIGAIIEPKILDCAWEQAP